MNTQVIKKAEQPYCGYVESLSGLKTEQAKTFH